MEAFKRQGRVNGIYTQFNHQSKRRKNMNDENEKWALIVGLLVLMFLVLLQGVELYNQRQDIIELRQAAGLPVDWEDFQGDRHDTK